MEAQLVKIQMVREGVIEYPGALNNPHIAYKIFRNMFRGADREQFAVICLDQGKHVNCVNIVSVGSLAKTTVHAREVFKPAILANAASIILGHNHTGGSLEPSSEDIAMTAQLIEAGEILGIPVDDHLILREEEGFFAMRTSNATYSLWEPIKKQEVGKEVNSGL
jgi:DNA repair protein RadC